MASAASSMSAFQPSSASSQLEPDKDDFADVSIVTFTFGCPEFIGPPTYHKLNETKQHLGTFTGNWFYFFFKFYIMYVVTYYCTAKAGY